MTHLSLDLRTHARRALPPLRDPGSLLAATVATWRGRMINEWSSSYVFGSLAEQLDAACEPEAARMARTFAAEERRHGVLCGAVVEAAGGEARAVIARPGPVPVHRDASRRVAAVRNVLSIGLAETVAVALIGAERLEMPEGPLRELLTAIWADEVGHARFGWGFLDRMLPLLDAQERAALERYLPVLLDHLVAHEHAHLPERASPPPEGAAFGLCSGRDARVLFAETVNEVIVPELSRRGLEVRWSGPWAPNEPATMERKVA
jgi:hypothetical protein